MSTEPLPNTSGESSLIVSDLGLAPYGPVLERQRALQQGLIAFRRSGEGEGSEHLLLVEHEPVITLGRHARETNLLFSREALAGRGIAVYDIERGGDVTYHGPGQLVAYLIIDLERHHLGVKRYVWMLEEAVIRTIARWGIRGERVEGATGVWIGKDTPGERKICAIGVKCSRFVTMHGLALNVNTDLSPFTLINPCGFTDRGVTSMARETGREIPMREVKETLAECFNKFLHSGMNLSETADV